MAPASLIVVLDANVLYPFTLRDTLLRAAEVGLCQPRWTTDILDEMERNLVANNVMPADDATRLRTTMEEVFPEADVTDYQSFIAAAKNDAKDRHVVAAAIKAGASMIVTSNLKDFHPLPEGLEALSPDDFLCELLHHEPASLIRVLQQQAADLTRPSITFDDLLERLEKVTPTFVRKVRTYSKHASPILLELLRR